MRGHIRIGRAFGEAQQEKILRAAGVNTIYKNDPEAAVKSCRQKEPLYVAGLRGLAGSKTAILAHLAALRSKDAVAVDAATGRRSDRDGAELMAEAIIDLGNERMGGHAAARLDGRSGGKKAGENRRARKLPAALAEKIWHDKSLTNAEAVLKINAQGYKDDWLPGALYKNFGKRGVVVGRIGKNGRQAPAAPDFNGGAKAKRGKRGYVYFMRINGRGPVKIGFTVDLKDRLKTHAGSNHGTPVLVAAMHGTQKAEGRMHKKFEAALVPGKREWFKMTAGLKAFIETLPEIDEVAE